MATSGDAVSGAINTTTTATKPLTVFYNGGVAVFHLPQDKAEEVMKMAVGQGDGDDGRKQQGAADHGDALLAKLKQGLPIASRRSLQRFFEKRKERLHRP